MDQSQNLMSEVDEDLVETAFEANQIPWLETELHKKLCMGRNYKLTREWYVICWPISSWDTLVT